MTRYLVTEIRTWEVEADSESVAADAVQFTPDTIEVQVERLPDAPPDLTTAQ